MMGRPPIPSHLKRLRGNPGKRPISALEPKPEAGIPDCPAWLEGEALAEWKIITAQLEKMGLLFKVDKALLVAYCEAWAEFVEAVAEIKKSGRVVNNCFQSPWVGVKNKAVERMNRIAGQFGLSPSARTRIEIIEREKEDPFESFVSGR